MVQRALEKVLGPEHPDGLMRIDGQGKYEAAEDVHRPVRWSSVTKC
jgi:hypothetical protein